MTNALYAYENLRVMTLAQRAANFSALCCPRCEQPLTHCQEQHILFYGNQCECKGCGKKVWIENSSPMVEPDSAPFLDKKGVMTAEWYHATNRAEWMNDLMQDEKHIPLVHIGTEASAMARATQEHYTHLYSVRLKPRTSVYEKIVMDNNQWPVYVTSQRPYRMPSHAVRYLNVWENPGSISLLIDPRRIEVVSHRIINPVAQTAA